MRRPVTTIEVSVSGHPPTRFVGRTAAGAFYDAWLSFSDCRACSFGEFMRLARKRVVPNAPGVGDPIRVLGRNAWSLGSRSHMTRFIYVEGGPIMSAHHSEIQEGHR